MSIRERESGQPKPLVVVDVVVFVVVIGEVMLVVGALRFVNLYSCLRLSKVCSN